jgi:hypothetical protein
MAKIRVLVISPGSAVARLETIEPELEVFNRLVDGWIEGLSLTADATTYLNTDGKATGLPVNGYADSLVRLLLAEEGRSLLPWDSIVGPVVFLGQPDRAGEDTDVPERLLELAREVGMEIEEVPRG